MKKCEAGIVAPSPLSRFFPSQALGDKNREPGRLYDLEYESDDEAEEEKVVQNPSKPRYPETSTAPACNMVLDFSPVTPVPV